jgi:oligoribonuclease
MAPVVVEMHARSGLTDRIRASAVTLEDAEQATVDFVSEHIVPGTAPLAGNSVWKDKEFIDRYMKRLAALMHYRIVDVSTLKELVARWFPPEMKAPKKKETHRALDDIRESIEELAYYRANVIKPPALGSR